MGLLDKVQGLLGKGKGLLDGVKAVGGTLGKNSNTNLSYLSPDDDEAGYGSYSDSSTQKSGVNIAQPGSGWLSGIINGFTNQLDGVPVKIPSWVKWLGIGFLFVLVYKLFAGKKRSSSGRRRSKPRRPKSYRRTKPSRSWNRPRRRTSSRPKKKWGRRQKRRR